MKWRHSLELEELGRPKADDPLDMLSLDDIGEAMGVSGDIARKLSHWS
jgi:hypothetical protein